MSEIRIFRKNVVQDWSEYHNRLSKLMILLPEYEKIFRKWSKGEVSDKEYFEAREKINIIRKEVSDLARKLGGVPEAKLKELKAKATSKSNSKFDPQTKPELEAAISELTRIVTKWKTFLDQEPPKVWSPEVQKSSREGLARDIASGEAQIAKYKQRLTELFRTNAILTPDMKIFRKNDYDTDRRMQQLDANIQRGLDIIQELKRKLAEQEKLTASAVKEWGELSKKSKDSRKINANVHPPKKFQVGDKFKWGNRELRIVSVYGWADDDRGWKYKLEGDDRQAYFLSDSQLMTSKKINAIAPHDRATLKEIKAKMEKAMEDGEDAAFKVLQAQYHDLLDKAEKTNNIKVYRKNVVQDGDKSAYIDLRKRGRDPTDACMFLGVKRGAKISPSDMLALERAYQDWLKTQKK